MEFHYRSPEHFHEIVLSGGKLAGLNKHVHTSVGDLRFLAEQLGPRLLVMKSEDLSKWSFLAKLAAFVNVPVSGFDAELATMRTNSQFRAELRGKNKVSNVTTETLKGLYEISGFRPMQCMSRKLIYTRYREVCQAWQTDFNLTYAACLSADALECPGATFLANRRRVCWAYKALSHELELWAFASCRTKERKRSSDGLVPCSRTFLSILEWTTDGAGSVTGVFSWVDMSQVYLVPRSCAAAFVGSGM